MNIKQQRDWMLQRRGTELRAAGLIVPVSVVDPSTGQNRMGWVLTERGFTLLSGAAHETTPLCKGELVKDK